MQSRRLLLREHARNNMALTSIANQKLSCAAEMTTLSLLMSELYSCQKLLLRWMVTERVVSLTRASPWVMVSTYYKAQTAKSKLCQKSLSNFVMTSREFLSFYRRVMDVLMVRNTNPNHSVPEINKSSNVVAFRISLRLKCIVFSHSVPIASSSDERPCPLIFFFSRRPRKFLSIRGTEIRVLLART